MPDTALSGLDFRTPLEAPEENLDVEFKLEFDLSRPEDKAKLAKEIAALCNFGGGWIVLGRGDDGNYPASLPASLHNVDQDMVNQIASAYLIPAPHCTLRRMRPDGFAFDVLVIRVPSVGVVPVCGKKNGPQDEKNRVVGIQKATYYIRTAGPVSAPIASPEEWNDLIRRCVLSDKTALLGALSVMVSQPSARSKSEPSQLDRDWDYMVQRWQQQVSVHTHHVDLSKNFVAFGFELISSGDRSKTTTSRIKSALSARSSHHYGPHRFFEEGMPGDGRPHVIENAGVDGLQADCITHDGHVTILPSMWRINEVCCGVEILSYWEDTEYLKSAVEETSSRKWEPAQNLWIAIQMEYIEGFLSNVRYLAEQFGVDGKARVRVSYHGLEGRNLDSPRLLSAYSGVYPARQDQRNIDLTFELAALEDEVRSSAVATIIQNLNKLFQGPEISAEVVVRMLGQLRRNA